MNEIVGSSVPSQVREYSRPGLARRLLRNPLAVFGLIVIVAFAIIAIAAPLLAPYDPNATGLGPSLQTPSADHAAGLDKLGRDVLSRVIYGTRVSLVTGVAAIIVALVLGGAVAILAGWLGGNGELVLMRVVDIFLAVPSILLAIGTVAVLGQGVPQLIVAVGIAYAAVYARILHRGIVAVRSGDFVTAAKALGASRTRVLIRHVVPNSLSPLIVAATLGVATAVLDVAALGFLGLGPPDPSIAEWGSMLSDSSELLRRAPHVLAAPAIAIVVAAIGFTFLGDALREALDPRLRK